MGRKKIKIEFIEDLGARIQKFKLRKEGLTKKLKELTTLCDIGACMIIYDPAQNQSFVWPNDRPDQVRPLIESYRWKNIKEVKSCGVSDYFEEKKKKVEAELLKLRKEKYPICNERLDSMNDEELRGLGDALRNKSEMIRSRIQMMRNMREMQDRRQLEMTSMLDSYNLNNLDHQQFLINPTIGAATTSADFGSYVNNINYCYDQNQNQNQIQNYYYNDYGNSADCYHINNLDHQQFLMNPTIATATDFGSYMDIPSSSSSVPLPQMMNNGYYNDDDLNLNQNQNQIQNYYCNDDRDDDEKKNDMVFWDGVVGTMEFPYTNSN